MAVKFCGAIWSMTMSNTIELVDYHVCQRALREPDLKQALYDEGAVLMNRVLVTLHGDEHRARRLLEMRVFRRDFFRHHEQVVIPQVFDEVMAPVRESGETDVVEFGYRMTVSLATAFAGIDMAMHTTEEFDTLIRMLRIFGTAATLGQSKLDRATVKDEIRKVLAEFDERFLAPSVARRLELIQALQAGTIGEDELPMDVLTVLLRNVDNIELDDDMILRETAFFFLAGAHTSVHSLSHSMHHILTWCEEHPEDRQKLVIDTALLQRFVHESFRLHPSSPVSWRKALADMVFANGESACSGDKVVISLRAANRDTSVFGPDAAVFNPYRVLPAGIPETGITFGIGMHACLGKNLAAGTLPQPGKSIDPEKRQLGAVTWITHALLAQGASKDPHNPGHLDQTIERETWARYPIRFDAQ